MELGESVYEFIDKFAYFACAANIVIENYTMTDNDKAYQEIMMIFDKYIDYYEKVESGVSTGKLTKETADAALRIFTNWLRNECISKFMEKMQMCIEAEFKKEIDSGEVKKHLDTLMEEIIASNFSTADLMKMVEAIRGVEEKIVR